MIIRDMTNAQTAEFGEVKKGGVFRYDGSLYLKIGNSVSLENAYGLEIEKTLHLGNDRVVEYIPSELILHPQGWVEE